MIDIRTVDCAGCGRKLESKDGCTINFGNRWRREIRLCNECTKEFSQTLAEWVKENIDDG